MKITRAPTACNVYRQQRAPVTGNVSRRPTMGALYDVLAPMLKDHFPGRGLRFEGGPPYRAVFPAICSDVGDLVVLDDGDEFTVVFGRFTHEHYGEFQFPPSTESEKEEIEEVSKNIVAILADVFADRVVMYGGKSAVGGHLHWLGDEPRWLPPGYGQKYVWSGPYNEDGG